MEVEEKEESLEVREFLCLRVMIGCCLYKAQPCLGALPTIEASRFLVFCPKAPVQGPY